MEKRVIATEAIIKLARIAYCIWLQSCQVAEFIAPFLFINGTFLGDISAGLPCRKFQNLRGCPPKSGPIGFASENKIP